ncbi:MAG: hypothetical protein V4813_01860 [Gemmatimonadota bacterium]
MPRALVMKRTIVPLPDRARYMERLQKRKTYYASAGCNFWVFEEAALNGAFIEFTEAPDRATLQQALANATDQVLDANRIYQEVALT